MVLLEKSYKTVLLEGIQKDFDCVKDFRSLRHFLQNILKSLPDFDFSQPVAIKIVQNLGLVLKKTVSDESFCFLGQDSLCFLLNAILVFCPEPSSDTLTSDIRTQLTQILLKSLARLPLTGALRKSCHFVELVSSLMRCSRSVKDPGSLRVIKIILTVFSDFFFKSSKIDSPGSELNSGSQGIKQPDPLYLLDEPGQIFYYHTILSFLGEHLGTLLRLADLGRTGAVTAGHTDPAETDRSISSQCTFLFTKNSQNNWLTLLLDHIFQKNLFWPDAPEQSLRHIESATLALLFEYHRVFPLQLAAQFNLVQKLVLHSLVSASPSLTLSLRILLDTLSRDFLVNNANLLQSYNSLVLKQSTLFAYSISNQSQPSFGLLLRLNLKLVQSQVHSSDKLQALEPKLTDCYKLICSLMSNLRCTFLELSHLPLAPDAFNLALVVELVLQFQHFVETHREHLSNYLDLQVAPMVSAHDFVWTVHCLVLLLLPRLRPARHSSAAALALVSNHLRLVRVFRPPDSDLEQERLDFLHLASACFSFADTCTQPAQRRLFLSTQRTMFDHLTWLERVREIKDQSDTESRVKNNFISGICRFLGAQASPSRESLLFDLQENCFRHPRLVRQMLLMLVAIFEDLCRQQIGKKEQKMSGLEASLVAIQPVFKMMHFIIKQRIGDMPAFVIRDVLPGLLGSHDACKRMFLESGYVNTLREHFKDERLQNLVTQPIQLSTNLTTANTTRMDALFLAESPVLFVLDGLFRPALTRGKGSVFGEVNTKRTNQIISLLNEIFVEVSSIDDTRILKLFLSVLEQLIQNPDSSLLLQKQMIRSTPAFLETVRKHLKFTKKTKIAFEKRGAFLGFIRRAVHCRYLRKFFFRDSLLEGLFQELDSLFNFEFFNGSETEKENDFPENRKKKRGQTNHKKKYHMVKKNQLSELENLRSGNAKARLLVTKFRIAEHLIQIVLHLSFYESSHKSLFKFFRKGLVIITQNLRLQLLGQASRITQLSLSKGSFEAAGSGLPDPSRETLFFQFYVRNSDKGQFTEALKMNLLLINNLSLNKGFKSFLLENEKFVSVLLDRISRSEDAQLTCLLSQVGPRITQDFRQFGVSQPGSSVLFGKKGSQKRVRVPTPKRQKTNRCSSFES